MQTLIVLLAWLSFIVSSIYLLIALVIFGLGVACRAKMEIKIGGGFMVIMGMWFWPILYWLLA